MAAAERRMIMTEFISRIYGKEGYEIIIKTDSHEYYRATEDFARRLIDHSNCGTRILDNGHSWNYCPNCGAKMDLEENAYEM